MSSRTYGDVTNSLTACTVLDANGEPCGQPGAPRIPTGVCISHAIAITRSVLRLGDLKQLAQEAS